MGDMLVSWGVDPAAIAVLAAAYVAGYFLKGITGFAEAVPIIGIGSFFVDPLELVGMLTIADLAGGWVACLKSGEPMRTPIFDKTIGWQTGGMIATAVVLALVSQAVETGMFVLMLSITGLVFLLFIFRITPKYPGTRGMAVLAGVAGITTGMDGPLTSMTVQREVDAHTSRGAVMWMLNIINTLRVVPIVLLGGLTPLVLVMTVVALPTSWLGFHLGNKMHGGLSATAVRWVCVVLIALAIGSGVRSLV